VAAGRFDAALAALNDVPDDTPGKDALLGAAYLGRKNAAQALACLNRAALTAPEAPEILLLLGRAHMLAAAPGAAIPIFEKLAARSPARDDIVEALAGAYRRDARYGDAIRVATAYPTPTPQLLYELAMSRTSLGQTAESLADWDRLIERVPDLAAAWYHSHAPALERLGWPDAERRLEQAAACPKANGKYQAILAAYDVLAGRPPRPHACKHAYVVEGARALTAHLASDVRLFGMSSSLLVWALGEARNPGLVLEFGVRRGTSLTAIADAAGQEVHGFDSFEGLPESWGSSPQGVLTTGLHLPPVPGNARLHPGWFDATLPAFLRAQAGPVRFVNIDSDIYSSARTVLTGLQDRILPGTVLVFDEFIGNRSWAQDEFRAFSEFIAQTGRRFSVIAVNLATKQVAIRMLA
jgi:hypothetical protein